MRDRLRADEGFTLIEVIVACFLGVLVVGVVGGIYITTIGVQRVVGAMNQGTTDGQLAARDIDNGLRNGSEFEITTLVASGDQLLVVRSLDASEEGVWYCRAWYFSAGDGGSIRSHAVIDDPDTDGDITVPSAEQLAGWTLLAEGIRPSTGTTIFAQDPNFATVVAVDFTTDADDADGTRIRFSTPLMPGATPISSPSEEPTCL